MPGNMWTARWNLRYKIDTEDLCYQGVHKIRIFMGRKLDGSEGLSAF